ncbi:MAG TPA: elongation factor Ts [Nostocaceae cyanobacterium]|nr:elongation factor Ts [Nostocaceae cyanobacterium]
MGQISAQVVKELRQQTGAGMMDCKQALQATNGDFQQAIAFLRKKGITVTVGMRPVPVDGIIGSYIHTGGKVGVLVEVNCETDFVSRSEEFKSLVQEIAMQIAACPQVQYVKVTDIPLEIITQEQEIEQERDDLANKPEAVKAKIVQGRIDKRLKEMCLLDQAYIRDQSITVEQHIKLAIAQFGENIQVRRFSRLVLGKEIEKIQVNSQ